MNTYLVGGAVRDWLLRKPVADLDYVVVGSTPEEMLAAGYKQVGADFPVFLHPETNEEYALARTERKTGVGYGGFTTNHDPSVTLEDDLFRRDLTINAMALTTTEPPVLIDPYNGRYDLKDKVLAHVSPHFADDPLRVIRLARFYSRYTDFTIRSSTILLCKEIVDRGELNELSDERFWAELVKLFDQDGDVSRFFSFLTMIGALQSTRFFNDLFGELNQARLDIVNNVASFLGKNKLRAEDYYAASAENRAIVFSAVVGAGVAAQVSSAIPTAVKTLTKRVANAIEIGRAVVGQGNISGQIAKELFDLVIKTKLTTEMMSQLKSGIEVATRVGLQPWVSLKAAAYRAWLDGARITAANFPEEPPGRELGEKIAIARVREIWDGLQQLVHIEGQKK